MPMGLVLRTELEYRSAISGPTRPSRSSRSSRQLVCCPGSLQRRLRSIERVNRDLPTCTGLTPKNDVLSHYLLRIYAVDRSPNLQGSIAPKALYMGGCEFKTFDEFDVVLPKQFYGSASLYEVPVVGQKIRVLCEHAGQCRRVLFIECLCERVFKLLNIRLGLRYGTSRKHGNKGGCRYNRLDHFPLAETI